MSMLMSVLLEERRTLPAGYKLLLKDLTSAIFWEQQGNVPALTHLLQSYITCGPDFVVQSNLLLNILGVFQKLVASKINDFLGFYLLQSIIQYIPPNDFAFALTDIFKVIFIRLQGSKTTQLIKGFIVFLSYFIGKHGPSLAINTMSNIQQGIFLMVLQSLWIPHVESVKGKSERKACSIAMVRLLCEWPEMLVSPYVELWSKLLQQTVHLIEGHETETRGTQEDLFNEEEERGSHYTSGFTTLCHAPPVEVDSFNLMNPKTFLAHSLNQVYKSHSGKISPLVESIGHYKQILLSYFQIASIPFLN